jgi:hypothetical protein
MVKCGTVRRRPSGYGNTYANLLYRGLSLESFLRSHRVSNRFWTLEPRGFVHQRNAEIRLAADGRMR